MTFQKAQKKQVRLKLAITGPSGSGKTWGALELASALGSKIALIDTENGSASLYAKLFNFDVCELSAPFSTEKYQKAMDDAISAGYEIVIIDSITPEWDGVGGILEVKNQLDQRPGSNSYMNWAKPSAAHNRFIDSLISSPVHLIATIRSKQDYILDQDQGGKIKPRKVGLAPIQRDGVEYIFSVVFDVTLSHDAMATKDRTSLFDGRTFRLSKSVGQELTEWLKDGEPLPPLPTPREIGIMIDGCSTMEALGAIGEKLKVYPEVLRAGARETFLAKSDELKKAQR